MEEDEYEVPNPTKDDPYFELLSYVEITTIDYDGDLVGQMRMENIKNNYRKFFKMCADWGVEPETYKTIIYFEKRESETYPNNIILYCKLIAIKKKEWKDGINVLNK